MLIPVRTPEVSLSKDACRICQAGGQKSHDLLKRFFDFVTTAKMAVSRITKAMAMGSFGNDDCAGSAAGWEAVDWWPVGGDEAGASVTGPARV